MIKITDLLNNDDDTKHESSLSSPKSPVLMPAPSQEPMPTTPSSTSSSASSFPIHSSTRPAPYTSTSGSTSSYGSSSLSLGSRSSSSASSSNSTGPPSRASSQQVYVKPTTISTTTPASTTAQGPSLATAPTSNAKNTSLSPRLTSPNKSTPMSHSVSWPFSLPKSSISSKYLVNKELVKIAIRRKSVSKKSFKPMSLDSHSKLHFKSLEAGIRIKLTLAPSMVSLYRSLTSNVNLKDVRIFESSYIHESEKALNEELHSQNHTNVSNAGDSTNANSSVLLSKNVQLVDNNLVKLENVSNKILQSFKKDNDKNQVKYPIYNCLNTAIRSLFGSDEYTLIRVTRSTSSDPESSTLLKLEATNPGDLWLLDEEEIFEEMFYSIGKHNEIPSNLFIKKILARPRYKADMKIYLVPYKCNMSLYVDERMLERDLIKGVIDPKNPNERPILTAFDYKGVLDEVQHLVTLSEMDKQTLASAPRVHEHIHT